MTPEFVYGGGAADAFVAMLDRSGQKLRFATYLAGPAMTTDMGSRLGEATPSGLAEARRRRTSQ